jgi:ferredoxin-NADP reductase
VESADVTSFELTARDGQQLPQFEPGQHLPIEVNIAGRRHARTYSLSAAPDPNRYRVSIKRDPQGLVSQYLHDQLQAGDSLTTSDPAGEFTLRSGLRPVILMSAGIGVTPMISMLGEMVRTNDERRAWFVHGARDSDHHPLAQKTSALQSLSDRVTSHVSYSRPTSQDLLGVDYDRLGRADTALICELLEDLRDVDVYLCGPLPFMFELREGLVAAGVPEQQIYSETFGPGA